MMVEKRFDVQSAEKRGIISTESMWQEFLTLTVPWFCAFT